MKTIYHYTSLSGFEAIIKSKYIRLTNSLISNDKKEINWVMDLLMEMYPDRLSEILKIKTVFEIALKNYYKPHLACFSLDPDQLSQWRGYGNDGKGVSIGFNMDYFEKIKRIENREFVIGRIVYNKLKQKKLLSQLIEKENIFQKFDSIDDYFSLILYCSGLVGLGIRIKHNSFKEEKEVRLIHGYEEIAAQSDIFEYYFTNDTLKTFIEIPLDIQKNSDNIINEIVLGPKCKVDPDLLGGFLDVNGFFSSKITIRKSCSTYQ